MSVVPGSWVKFESHLVPLLGNAFELVVLVNLRLRQRFDYLFGLTNVVAWLIVNNIIIILFRHFMIVLCFGGRTRGECIWF